jgi:hypothetical protein
MAGLRNTLTYIVVAVALLFAAYGISLPHTAERAWTMSAANGALNLLILWRIAILGTRVPVWPPRSEGSDGGR